MNNLKTFSYEITYNQLEGDYKPSPEERYIMQKSIDFIRGIKKITPKYISSLIVDIDKYPENPQLKNYLSTAYKLSGNEEDHQKIVRQTVEQHPDYFFGKADLAQIYLAEERFEEAEALMEKFSDIGVLYPDRKVFHASEVKKFNLLAAEYFAMINDQEQLDTKLKILKKVADKTDYLKIEKRIKLIGLEQRIKTLHESQQTTKSIEGSFRAGNIQTTEAPIFQNDLIQELYHQDLSISEGIIAAILALPRETLIEDLEKVLQDAINRYEFFEETDSNEENTSFPIHAIMLLGELKSYKSLPNILNLLKQGDEFLEFWFMDIMESLLIRTLYLLGKEELTQLETFLKEPAIFWMCKTMVSSILTNIAELDAPKRVEVCNIFENTLHFFWENQHDEVICDHIVIASIINDMAHLQIMDIQDLMKRFYDAKLINLNIDGDWNEIEELYQYPAKPKVLAVPTLPETYQQLNDGEYIYNYVEYESHPIIKKKYDQMIKEALERNDDEYDEFFDDEDDEDYFYRPTQPLISTKIDRNSKINVRYTDGKLVNNVKYKKVEDDIAAGKCLIV